MYCVFSLFTVGAGFLLYVLYSKNRRREYYRGVANTKRFLRLPVANVAVKVWYNKALTTSDEYSRGVLSVLSARYPDLNPNLRNQHDEILHYYK